HGSHLRRGPLALHPRPIPTLRRICALVDSRRLGSLSQSRSPNLSSCRPRALLRHLPRFVRSILPISLHSIHLFHNFAGVTDTLILPLPTFHFPLSTTFFPLTSFFHHPSSHYIRNHPPLRCLPAPDRR